MRPVKPPSSCQRWMLPRYDSPICRSGASAFANAPAAAFFSGVPSAAAFNLAWADSTFAAFSLRTSATTGSPATICSGVSCSAPNAAA